MPSDPTYLGTVQDVQGASISVALAGSTVHGLAFIEGQGYRIGQLGSFVRIPMGFVDLFGIVSQVGASAAPLRLVDTAGDGYRWIRIQLVGEGRKQGGFRRGIGQYPTVGDTVHLVTESDLSLIYGRPGSGEFVRVGSVASAESVPALVDINKLVTRHCAVVGATGSGKSTTVASLLLSLSGNSTYPSSRVLVLDIHGEYAKALGEHACVYRVNAPSGNSVKDLYIPYWALSFDELLPLTFGQLDDSARYAVLDKITALKKSSLAVNPLPHITPEMVSADTPIPFSIHKLWFDLHVLMHATHNVQSSGQSDTTIEYDRDELGQIIERGDSLNVVPPKFRPQVPSKIYLSGSTLNIRRQVESLASRLRDSRFDFLFRPGDWTPDEAGKCVRDLDAWLAEWVGGRKPITVLDLSGVPTSVLSNLIGALLRVLYDALFWSRALPEGGRQRPLLVVLEEAHAYLDQGNTGLASSSVRRIVKEGRKYGIGAMIVSQRPSEIDGTILSQCGTIVAMRLSNSLDRSHITSAVSDSLEGLLSMLPILRTGEAIIVGEAVAIPLRTMLEPPPLDKRPDSGDPLVYCADASSGWNKPRSAEDYAKVVRNWRTQQLE